LWAPLPKLHTRQDEKEYLWQKNVRLFWAFLGMGSDGVGRLTWCGAEV
jgi:hypothetical protein